MYLSCIKNRVTKLSLLILLAVLMPALVGFQDIAGDIAKHGVKYTFKARIIDKETSKEGQGLVVEKTGGAERAKVTVRSEKGKGEEGVKDRIYVVVTGETKIGYTVERYRKKYIKFDDLEIGWSVMIEGIKAVQRVDGQEIIVVLAKDIEPVE